MAGSGSGSSSPRRPERRPTPRSLAAEVVAAVLGGASLDAALPPAQARLGRSAHAAADRALLQALCYGVLREWRLLEAIAARLLSQPLRAGEIRLQALLCVGLHQLRTLRMPAHAAVAETVAATALIGRDGARGLVNAVLRRYLRERERIEAALPEDPGLRQSHPDWLVDALRADWPDDWPELLAANNRPGPMTLRVNLRRGTRADYLARLAGAGLAAEAAADTGQGVTLQQPVPVGELPGFAEGAVSVQDAAAQLAAPLLELRDGQRVLDACAAPGGKSGHILELAAVELLALDRDAARLARVRENLDRLELGAQLLAADAGTPAAWWDGRPFDRILLDAPCSGTGVIRRHPDIKWLRREADIPALVAEQRRLLAALWPLLAPGGVLVYASCSVLAAEGPALVADFLAAQPQAAEWPIHADWGEASTPGRRIRTGADGMDGFYYARLRRQD